MQQEDDFVAAVVETVARTIKLSNPQRERIDSEIRQAWAGFRPHIAARAPSLRQAIRDALGTHEEIARKFHVNRSTVWRIRKGR